MGFGTVYHKCSRWRIKSLILYYVVVIVVTKKEWNIYLKKKIPNGINFLENIYLLSLCRYFVFEHSSLHNEFWNRKLAIIETGPLYLGLL